jgi:hypothetical protein
MLDEEFDEEFVDRCCICHKEYGLVWDMPDYRSAWVHFHCALKKRAEAREHCDRRPEEGRAAL